MANSQSAYKKRPTFYHPSLYWSERELMLELKCFSKLKETFRVLSSMNCWCRAESGVHRKHMAMGSQGGVSLHCPLFFTLPAGYNEPSLPLEIVSNHQIPYSTNMSKGILIHSWKRIKSLKSKISTRGTSKHLSIFLITFPIVSLDFNIESNRKNTLMNKTINCLQLLGLLW